MLIKFALFLWILLLNLGQFSALSKGSLGGVYLFDIFAVAFVVWGFLYLLVVKDYSLGIPKLYFPLLVFLFIAVVSLIAVFPLYSGLQLTVAVFYLVRFAIYVFAGILLYNFLAQNIISRSFIYFLLAFSAIFLAFTGFLQLAFLPDFTVLPSELGWDPHQNRMASTFFDPNFLGAYFVLLFNFFLALKDRKFTPPLIMLIAVSIFLTFSRSAWLMLALSIAVWGVFKYRFFLVLAAILAFSAYFAVPRVQTRISGITDPADSAHFRLISWRNTWEIAQDHLFLGTGFNTFRFVQKDYGFFGVEEGGHSGGGSDSSLLLVLATTGVLGFAPFLVFWGSLGASALSNLQNNFSLVLLASLVSLLAESFFINSLFYPQIMFLWGLGIALFLANLSYT